MSIMLITAQFQPAPLIDAMRSKGHDVFVATSGSEAWEVWIRRS
jgi:hypothetical protein